MEIIQTETFLWIHANLPFLQPFLHTDNFATVYGLVVFMNPFAVIPQLVSSIRSEPKELRGVSISMFVLFWLRQSAITLGAIKIEDFALFTSMAISGIITLSVIMVTLIRRDKQGVKND